MKALKFLTILFALTLGAAIDATAQEVITAAPVTGEPKKWTFSMPDGDVRVKATFVDEPYFILTDNDDVIDETTGTKGKTLTFYYDGNIPDNNAYEINVNPGFYDPINAAWSKTDGDFTTVTKVVFDKSFANVKPTNCNSLFEDFTSLKTITDIKYLNTSEVTDMGYMFKNCSSLTSLDLSTFNTSKVGTDQDDEALMSEMFYGCSSLTLLDLSSFNTENVNNMRAMFYGCSGLKSLVLSSFNTANVTDMSNMFYGCSSLTTLNVSNFNTGNVEKMNGMFHNCYALSSLDLSNFNTGSVTSMGAMFQMDYTTTTSKTTDENGNEIEQVIVTSPTPQLSSITFGSNFTTKNVWSMSEMFAGCSRLASISLNTFTSEILTHTDGMFFYCKGLTSIEFSESFTAASVQSMSEMFKDCSGLTSLDLSKFSPAAITDMSNMFDGCTNLKTIQFGTFTAGSNANMGSMFLNCSSLTTLDLKSFHTTNVTNMSHMFEGCSALTAILVNKDNWDVGNVTENNSFLMFSGCSKLIGERGTECPKPEHNNYLHPDKVTNDFAFDKDYACIDDPANEKGYLSTAYTVIYDLAGGELSSTTGYTQVGETNVYYKTLADAKGTSLPIAPSSTSTATSISWLGNTFNGWKGSNGTTPTTAVTIPEAVGNYKYTADWKQNLYSVKLDDESTNVYLSPISTNTLYAYDDKIEVKLSDGVSSDEYTITAVKYSYTDESGSSQTKPVTPDATTGKYTFNVPLTAPDAGTHDGYIGTVTVSATVKANQTITADEIAALIQPSREYNTGFWAQTVTDNKLLDASTMLEYTNASNNETVYLSFCAAYLKADGEYAINAGTAESIEVQLYGIYDKVTENDGSVTYNTLPEYSYVNGTTYKLDSYDKFTITTDVHITPKKLTPTISGTVTKKYDGGVTVTSTLEVTQLDGICDGESGTVEVDAIAGTYPAAKVGSYLTTGTTPNPVTLSITLKGANKDNYTVEDQKVNGTITALEQSYTLGLGANYAVSLPVTSLGQGTDAVKYADGKLTTAVTTAVQESPYVLEDADKNVKISVTVKDYADGLFDNDWHKSVTVSSINEDASVDFLDAESKPDYFVTVKVGSTNLTANNDNNFVISTEGSAVQVTYTITDKAVSNTYHSTTHTVKIDGTAPTSPCVEYTDDNETKSECGAGAGQEEKTLTIPENTQITLYANDDLSGVAKIFYTGATNETGVEPTYNSTKNRYESIYIPTVGVHTLSLNAKDMADNSQTQPMLLTLTVTHPVTITFDGNGGTLGSTYLAAPTALIEYDGTDANKTYTIPAASVNYYTRTGYTLSGWNTLASPTEANPGVSYKADGTSNIAIAATTADLTLYAQWTPTEYTITYYDEDGETKLTNTGNPVKYTIETETFTLDAPTKNGYVFGGWKKGRDFITEITKGTTGDITLTATWDEYTIEAPEVVTIYQSGNKVNGVNPVTTATLSYTVKKNGGEITENIPTVTVSATDGVTCSNKVVSATKDGTLTLSLPADYNCTPVNVPVDYTELPEITAYFNYGTDDQEQFNASTYYDFDDAHKTLYVIVPNEYPAGISVTNGLSRKSTDVDGNRIYSVTFSERIQDADPSVLIGTGVFATFVVKYKDVLTVTAKDFEFGKRPDFNSDYLEVKDSNGDNVASDVTLTFSYKKQDENDDKYQLLAGGMPSLSGVPAGKYTLKVALKDNDQVVAEGTDDFEIKPQTATVKFADGADTEITYTGSQITPPAVVAQYILGDETNTIDNTANQAYTLSYSPDDLTNAGDVTITFVDANVNDSYSFPSAEGKQKTLTFTIKKASLSLPETFDIANYVETTKTVDGTSSAQLKTGADAIEIPGVNNEEPVVKITSAKFIDQNGEEKNVIGTGYYIHAEFALTDADVNKNYQLSNEAKSKNFAANAEIKAEEVSITAAEIAALINTTKTYDGGTWVMDKAGNALKPDNSTISLVYNEAVTLTFSDISYDNANVAYDNAGNVASTKKITATALITDFTGTDTKIYKLPSRSFTVSTEGSITPADQAAPSLTSNEEEIICGSTDGYIDGVTAAMEYYIVNPNATTAQPYTSADGKDWAALAPGTYKIRYAATSNYNASPDATVTIGSRPIVVKFYDGNTELTALEQNNLCYDDYVAKPTGDDVPTKEGYTLSWTAGDDIPWDFAEDKVYDDTELRTVWTINKYAVALPANMEFVTSNNNNGIFAYGTTDIQFKAKTGFEASDVKMTYTPATATAATEKTLIADANGIYTIASMPAANVNISATVKEKVRLSVGNIEYTCGGTWSKPSSFYAAPYTSDGSGTMLKGTWTPTDVNGNAVSDITATGSYKVLFTPENTPENTNYTWALSDVFEITYKYKTLPEIALAEPTAEIIYDGTPKTPAITGLTGLTENTDYTIAYDNNENASISTLAKITVTGAGCYVGSEQTANFTIKPAALTAADLKADQKPTPNKQQPSGDNLVYNGESQDLVIAPKALPDGYSIVYKLSTEAATAYASTIPTAKDAATYTINVKYVGDNNHVSFDGDDVETPIDMAKATVTADNAHKTYGQNDPASFSATVSGTFGSGQIDYRVSRDKAGTTAGENVGKYAIIPTGEAVQGNYEVAFNNGEFEIKQATFTKEELADNQKPTPNKQQPSGDNLVYNGIAQNLVIAPEALPDGYTIQYKLSTATEFASTIPTAKDADTYTINVKYVGDANHASFDGYDVKTTIDKAKATVTAVNASKVFGESDPASFSVTVTGTFGSDQIDYRVSRTEGENVRKYAITPTGAAVQGNYEVTFKNGEFEITPFVINPDDPNLTITLNPTSYPYDGTAKEPAVTVTYKRSETETITIPANEYTVSYENNDIVSTKAKMAKAIITDNYGGNYTINGSKEFTILPVYNVTFHTAHGTPNPDKYENVVTGKTIDAPSLDNVEGYTFTGEWYTDAEFRNKWNFATPVDKNLDLYAKWNTNTYDIKFIVDGVETVKHLEYGVTPSYGDTDPTREATAQFTYTFDGWSPEITVVKGTATYTAQFKETTNKYAIKFVNYDGTVLQNTNVDYGELPVYNGTTDPTKTATEEFTYTFSGWDSEITVVDGAKTYTAQFSETKNKYLITFVDDEGNTLHTEEFEYGAVPTYKNGETPVKPSTAEFSYTFDRWETEFAAVTGTATYKALFTKTVNCMVVTVEGDLDVVYDGNEHKPTLTVKPANVDNPDLTLTYGVDYEIVWPEDMTHYGDHTITVQGLNDLAECANTQVLKIARRPVTVVINNADALSSKYGETISSADIDWTVAAETPLVTGDDLQLTFTCGAFGADATVNVGNYPIAITVGNSDYDVTFSHEALVWTVEQATYDASKLSAFDVDNETISGKKDGRIYGSNFKNFFLEYRKASASAPVEYTTVSADKTELTGLEPDDYFFRIKGDINHIASDDVKVTVKPGAKLTVTYNLPGEATPFAVQEYDYNGIVAAPTAPADKTESTFNGWWTSDGSKYVFGTQITESITLTASWKTRTYVITFVDGDGNEIQNSTVNYGAMPQYNGTAKPAKNKTAKYSYEFNGEWSPEIVAATENATYTAQFTEKLRSYTITFVIDDEATPKVTKQVTFDYGKMPNYEGSYKQSTDEFSYEFIGWDREFEEVTEDATYTAKYNTLVNCFAANDLYDVDYDGNVHQPEIIVHSVESDNFIFTSGEDYTLGWSSDLVNAGTVTATITGIKEYEECPVVTKSFEIHKITYAEPTSLVVCHETISKKRDGKITGVNSSMEYSEDGIDFKEIDEGRSELTDLAPGIYSIRVKADRNHNESSPVTLEVKESDTKLVVKFVNYNNDNLIDEPLQLDYNDAVAYTGSLPVKDLNDGFEYTFIGWKDNYGNAYDKDATLPNATRNVTYTAQFSDRDNVKPTVEAIVVKGDGIADGGVNAIGTEYVESIGQAEIAINASDDNSGVAKIEYSINGGVAKEYTVPFSLTDEGTYEISVTATDNASNTCDPVVAKVIVRGEATLTTTEYTYTQLSGKDVVLQGIDLHGADIKEFFIDNKDCISYYDKETNAIKSDYLNDFKVGEHTFNITTNINGASHSTGINGKLTVEGFDAEVEADDGTVDGYCNDDNAVITLTFKNDITLPKFCKIEGVNGDDYMDLLAGADSKSGVVNMKITTDIMNMTRDDNGDIVFHVTFYYAKGSNTESKVQSIPVTVNLSSEDLIVQLFEDIIAINNHDDLYTAFQWYKEGKKIEGADQQYWQNPDGKITGVYSAYVTMTNGKEMKICSANFKGEPVSKAAKRSINAYPNPARAGEEITLELINFDEAEYEECVIKIVNNAGSVVATINNCDRINTVTLPVGTYTGYVIRNGVNGKVSFKLIVK